MVDVLGATEVVHRELPLARWPKWCHPGDARTPWVCSAPLLLAGLYFWGGYYSRLASKFLVKKPVVVTMAHIVWAYYDSGE